jgi:hypothetical protein
MFNALKRIWVGTPGGEFNDDDNNNTILHWYSIYTYCWHDNELAACCYQYGRGMS